MAIEVEIRSFITMKKYEELVQFFKKNGKLVSEDEQESHYMDAHGDVRIQRNKFYSKIWLKKGKLHDEQREEIEVKVNKMDFDKLGEIFAKLGYKPQIKWFRKRHTFLWKGITVTLDHTRGYGYIVEFEKMSNERRKGKDLALLKEKFKSLDLRQTSREELNSRYEHYRRNWQVLTK